MCRRVLGVGFGILGIGYWVLGLRLWVELESGGEGGLVDLLPGDLVLMCDRSAVFIFWLEIENWTTGLPLGHFYPYRTIISLDRLPKAMEYGALLGGSANAERRRFSEDHLFTGLHVIRWANHRKQDARAGFFHADRLGEHV